MVIYLERGREFFFGCIFNGMLKGVNFLVRGLSVYLFSIFFYMIEIW